MSTYGPGEFLFQYPIISPFRTIHGVLKARILPFPSPVGHILLELSTMTHPSWVALHGMAHSFIELDKAVVHVIGFVSFLNLSFHFSSVTPSCVTLCDPMNHSVPGLPVHHQLPEFTQTHVHRVGDAIQPSHPL